MAAKNIRAGKAFVEVGVLDRLSPALAKIGARLQVLGRVATTSGLGIAAAGVGMTLPFVAAARVFDETGSALADISARTGASVEALSALGYAADLSGASSEDVEKGLRKLAQTVDAAGRGSDTAAAALARLGTSAAELQGLSADKQLAALADGLAKLEGSERTAAALEVLGRGGTKLIPILSSGAAGLAAMTARAEELGIVIGGESARAADQFGDRLSEVAKQLRAVAFYAGEAVAGGIMPWVPAVQKALRGAIDWTRANRGLVLGAAAAAVGVVTLGAGVMALGAVVWSSGVVVSALATGVGLLGSVLAAVATPAGLVVSGLVGLGVAAGGISGRVGAAVKNVVGWLGGLWEGTRVVLGNVMEALKAGEWQLAAEYMWASIKLAWLDGTAGVYKVYVEWRTKLVQAGISLWASLQEIWENGSRGLAEVWGVTLAGMQKVMISFAGGVADIWGQVTGVIAKGMLAMDSSLSQAEVDQGFETIDEQNSGSAAARRVEEMKAFERIDQDRDARLKAIDEARSRRLVEIRRQEMELSAAASANGEADLRRVEAERERVRRLKAELERQINLAAAGRDPTGILDRLAKAGLDTGDMEAGVTSRAMGTFSGAGAGQIIGATEGGAKQEQIQQGIKELVGRIAESQARVAAYLQMNKYVPQPTPVYLL